MYLVDNSVWIHALRRGGNQEIRSRLRTLVLAGETAVTEWILLELMPGLSRSEDAKGLLERFSPVTLIPFRQEWWAKAWDLAADLRKHGVTPSAADCLIATLALESSVAVIHCDQGFEAARRHSKLQTQDWSTIVQERRAL